MGAEQFSMGGKNMKKRLITLLLGITLTVSTLAGCGNTNYATSNDVDYDGGESIAMEYPETEPMVESESSYDATYSTSESATYSNNTTRSKSN